jgi:hypothetical protein
MTGAQSFDLEEQALRIREALAETSKFRRKPKNSWRTRGNFAASAGRLQTHLDHHRVPKGREAPRKNCSEGRVAARTGWSPYIDEAGLSDPAGDAASLS